MLRICYFCELFDVTALHVKLEDYVALDGELVVNSD